MNVDSTPQIILFTRISSYKKYIEHETNDESDDDDTESVWSSDHSNECWEEIGLYILILIGNHKNIIKLLLYFNHILANIIIINCNY